MRLVTSGFLRLPSGGNRGARTAAMVVARAWMVLFVFFLSTTTTTNRFASASTRNPLFSSNVVTLDSSNWKETVVDNPHLVLVNICRKG